MAGMLGHRHAQWNAKSTDCTFGLPASMLRMIDGPRAMVSILRTPRVCPTGLAFNVRSSLFGRSIVTRGFRIWDTPMRTVVPVSAWPLCPCRSYIASVVLLSSQLL